MNGVTKETALTHIINLTDDRTFDYLYEKYWDRLLNFAGKYVDDRETCKEIVQELFISLHVKREQLHIQVSLTAYLYSSLRNKILNHIRNESVYKKHIAMAGQSLNAIQTGNEVENFLDEQELEREIFICLNKLPAKYREVFILNKQEAYTLKKTAEILQRPVNTVEKQLRKAVRHVQEYLRRRKAYW
jgi:RNA polymerase sigma-70 factor (ECF subfamily)